MRTNLSDADMFHISLILRLKWKSLHWEMCALSSAHIIHLHYISYSIRFAHLGLCSEDGFFTYFLQIFRLFHLSLEREFFELLKAAYSLGFRGVSDVKT